MKLIESIYYLCIVFAASIKFIMVSSPIIQEATGLVITILGFLYIFFNTHLIAKDNIGKILILYAIALFLSSILWSEKITTIQFTSQLLLPILFLSSYIYFIKQPQNFKYVKYFGLIAILISYWNLNRLVAAYYNRTSQMVQTSAGNSLVALLPFVLLWKNRTIQFALTLIIFMGSILAMKRSGFIIFMSVLYIYAVIKQHKGFYNRTTVYFLIVLLLCILVMQFIPRGLLLLERLTSAAEDGGSGRDELIERSFLFFKNNTFITWLFGNGYEGFKESSWNLLHVRITCAHNDYLEILYDAGVFAFGCFIAFLIRTVKWSIKLYHEWNFYTPIFSACLIVFLGGTLFICSYVHYWYYPLLYSLFGASYAMSIHKS